MHTKTSDVLNAIRTCAPSHDELVQVFAGLASCIKYNELALGETCKRIVVDLLDQSAGEVTTDKENQEAVTAWEDSKHRRMA